MAFRRALALVSWKKVRLLFVAESAILLRWPSRAWMAKSPGVIVAVANTA